MAGTPIPVLNTVVAQQMNILAYANDTASFDVQFLEDDGVTPKSIAGVQFKMQLKVKNTDATAKQTFNMTNGFTIGGADDSVLSFNGPLGLKGVPYYFDIQATDAGVITTYLYGQVLPFQDITT